MAGNKIPIYLILSIHVWPSVCLKVCKENQKGLDADMKKIRKKLDSKGFTILEVMMGMVIFSIGLLTLLSMLVISISGNAWSEKTTQTVQMVRETIETIKNTPEDQMEDYGYEDEDGIFRHWYVEDSYEDQGDVKKVTVWVYWTDEFNRSQYTSTTTYFQPKK
ncbi:MAG: prepilin-type N-terminal cleavage/methylation domain-containing protein [candidate division Zixibacteria bacterium]|nr:prepilin-type N-terminal cleavage/methylation domain-containing protein [candidate division Zixibacteria bacterium]